MKAAAVFVAVAFLVSFLSSTHGARNLVSNTLGSHMVLQRAPMRARLWGWTSQPSTVVSITLDGNFQFRTTSGADSKWLTALPPTSAGGPHSITIEAGTESVTLSDIYFGDVYVCSGQSNMQMTVKQTFNATEEIQKANNYPHVRIMTVGQGTISHTPLEELATIEQGWSIADSHSVGYGAWSYFSSLCWFFGRDLFDKYQVPIGLVSTNWGGTFVQAWSSPDALAKCPTQKFHAVNSLVAGKDNPNQNSVLWNAMIVPFLDMRIRGGIWYQGESNVGQAKYYGCAFPEMIKDWRDKWGLSAADFPFFFIQLAAYTQGGPYGSLLAELRFSQTKALAVPYVGMATAIDLGDLGSPDGNIHPRDKQALGYRSRLIAQAMIYGDQSVIYEGPKAVNMTVLAPGPAAVVRVHFSNQDKGEREPVFHSVLCPESLLNTKECGWYEILASNGDWVNATAALGQRNGFSFLDLKASLGSNRAVGARYAYSDWPVCTLYNKAGLPAPPFIFPPPF